METLDISKTTSTISPATDGITTTVDAITVTQTDLLNEEKKDSAAGENENAKNAKELHVVKIVAHNHDHVHVTGVKAFHSHDADYNARVITDSGKI